MFSSWGWTRLPKLQWLCVHALMYWWSTRIVHYNYIITVLNGILQYYCNTVMSHFSMVLHHNLQHYCNGYNIHYSSVALLKWLIIVCYWYIPYQYLTVMSHYRTSSGPVWNVIGPVPKRYSITVPVRFWPSTVCWHTGPVPYCNGPLPGQYRLQVSGL